MAWGGFFRDVGLVMVGVLGVSFLSYFLIYIFSIYITCWSVSDLGCW